jgi:hypothetical protein
MRWAPRRSRGAGSAVADRPTRCPPTCPSVKPASRSRRPGRPRRSPIWKRRSARRRSAWRSSTPACASCGSTSGWPRSTARRSRRTSAGRCARWRPTSRSRARRRCAACSRPARPCATSSWWARRPPSRANGGPGSSSSCRCATRRAGSWRSACSSRRSPSSGARRRTATRRAGSGNAASSASRSRWRRAGSACGTGTCPAGAWRWAASGRRCSALHRGRSRRTSTTGPRRAGASRRPPHACDGAASGRPCSAAPNT